MKRFILILIVFTGLTGVTFGQFALGVRLGYNANKLTTNIDSIKSDFNSGFHVGVWARIGKRIYVAPEIQYSLSGGVFTNEGTVSNPTGWKQKINVGSFDIPILLGVKIIHSDYITWRVEVGPEASFVVNKKITNDGLNPPVTEDNINTANWYIMAGTGVDFLFMSLDVRYKYQLNKFITDVQNNSLDSKCNNLIVSLGFKLFGKK